MARAYFDASALVKLVVDEAGSSLAAELWDHGDLALASRLAYPEVRAALAAMHRNRTLSRRAFDDACTDFDRYWSAVRPIELDDQVARAASSLAATHALKAADAIHLASALELGDPDLLFAVWDRRLHQGVRDAGLRTVPATLDD